MIITGDELAQIRGQATGPHEIPIRTWRQSYNQLIQDLWRGYDSTAEFDPNTVACTLGLAEEIRLGLNAGLLDGPKPDAVPVTAPTRPPAHGTRAWCMWNLGDAGATCGAPIVYSAVAHEWFHDLGTAEPADHRAQFN